MNYGMHYGQTRQRAVYNKIDENSLYYQNKLANHANLF